MFEAKVSKSFFISKVHLQFSSQMSQVTTWEKNSNSSQKVTPNTKVENLLLGSPFWESVQKQSGNCFSNGITSMMSNFGISFEGNSKISKVWKRESTCKPKFKNPKTKKKLPIQLFFHVIQ